MSSLPLHLAKDHLGFEIYENNFPAF